MRIVIRCVFLPRWIEITEKMLWKVYINHKLRASEQGILYVVPIFFMR